MTRRGTTACIWAGLSLLLLSGCASDPLFQSGQATSTDSADAMDRELQQALEVRAQERTGPPADVAAALLPSLGRSSVVLPPDRFDVAADGLDARRFFQSLVRGTEYNVAVHPDVAGTVSVDLQAVTLPEVMELVGDLYGYEIQRNDNFYRIMPGGLRTRIFQIDYLNMTRTGGSETQVSSGSVSGGSGNGEAGAGAQESDPSTGLVGTRITTSTQSDFWRELTASLEMLIGAEEGRRVVATPATGVVVVRAQGHELKTVEDYLRRTQLIMKRQVVLEAKILEVILNEGYQQGVNWNFAENLSSSVDGEGVYEKYVLGGLSGQTLATTDINGVFSAALRIGDFNSLISLLGTQGNVQVLSSPRIATTNNQKAVIKVGSDEFFVTDIDFDDNNTLTGATNSTSTSVELTPFFSGISLDVTPQISEDGLITLHVHPSVSEVTDQKKVLTVGERDVVLPLAQSTVRETDSVITARSGQIVVIGGLMQNQSEENSSAVPFFSQIPLIGELFKQRRFSGRKSELVILLRPVITGESTAVTDIAESRARIGVLRSLLGSPEGPTPQAAD
ncbi:pilus (MSHA type) biogenesis protein MshL [Hydrocarboniclastica marina]|uniref:Pilus (MSHA type) biogenesis protein MshL n=1 Tax=Hydrocarboniclastica marina TaxID=2259620 RepID=A0A4V1D8F3_9ALTE|nr:pilus (MSHA type) biogenesis protein MshL [Hydrocarboniclastica marina]MAL99602.1 pilus (MSHA type) biogenesis protein MshL [Alteromonadaceae bacterium]QCF24990.1 pilus (MSHA type) biogenesis protein MshL [Hydrocarboniclastica marina]